VAEEGVERRLTTILAADVVGYSRFMATDEAGTLTSLKAIRRELFEPKTTEHHGRVVKLIGDGTLMEFGSVVDAVTFAVDVQRAMAKRNADVPEDRRITYRMGINIGDIIVEGDDIYGDGVNIAARLEGLAESGGICVSGTVFNHVKGKVDLKFADLGERQLKNIPRSLRVYSVALEPKEGTARDAVAPLDQAAESEVEPPRKESGRAVIGIDLSLPEKPSIAVLPFHNMSTDPEQEFFSDGVTEDIITALSKIDSLLVVARNSTFTYKGTAVDVKQVSREQGVRYVLEGSVRKAGRRVRVTAQLIDATTGHHLWAERYDRDLEDIFAVQDEITREVVVALDVRLREGEQIRLWSSGTKNLEAWECVRVGADLANRITLIDRTEAKALFKKALELDPNYAIAWVMLGWTYYHDADVGTGMGLESGRVTALESVLECAQAALELDPNCADAYAEIALCHLSNGEYDQAIAMSKKAISLAPNIAENLAISAVILSKAGQPSRSIELIRKAMRLCPIYPIWYLYALGTACRLTHENDSAVDAFKEAVKRSPDYLAPHVGLASALGELGQSEEAKETVFEILRLEPDFSIKKYIEGLSYRDNAELERFQKGLLKAGLPA
jgi:adenylate cyclase